MNNLPRSRRKRTVIYDFDGTLFNTPHREEGELLFLEATGQTLPFPGWWGRLESMTPPVFPQHPGEEFLVTNTISAFREDEKDSDTERILMTGRPFKHRKRVLEICGCHNLTFHAHYFRGMPGQKGRDTLEIKSNIIETELIHSNLEILEIHEDRMDHMSAFFNLARRWKSLYDKHLSQIYLHNAVTGEKHTI